MTDVKLIGIRVFHNLKSLEDFLPFAQVGCDTTCLEMKKHLPKICDVLLTSGIESDKILP